MGEAYPLRSFAQLHSQTRVAQLLEHLDDVHDAQRELHPACHRLALEAAEAQCFDDRICEKSCFEVRKVEVSSSGRQHEELLGRLQLLEKHVDDELLQVFYCRLGNLF